MKKIFNNEYIVEIEENLTTFVFFLKDLPLERYFGDEVDKQLKSWQNEGLGEFVLSQIEEKKEFKENLVDLKIEGLKLIIKLYKFDEKMIKFICQQVRANYEEKEMHITRMFGSFILLQKLDGKLSAVLATEIPIKYCPLMIKLLKEVGGENAESLLKSLQIEDKTQQKKQMCKLINEVVIEGGYFDTNRPLNSCEANVLFGASETMSSAFERGLIDCAVIVSNNLGTIITTNSSNTQGAVKRMTGLFYSSPSAKLVESAIDAKIIPVFPYTSNIDQLAGVKEAIRLGYKKIAVSVASHDNYLHSHLKQLETNGVKIYKFGLCSTGISEQTALTMKDSADVVWSCASKYVKKHIAPNAIAQVGIKIPVYIMTEAGFEIIFSHLKHIDKDLIDFSLSGFEGKPVFLNSNGKIKVLSHDKLHSCADCPHPCI